MESEMDIEIKENVQYKVVVNHEEQYALWMHGRENAPGWEDIGVTGTKSECLTYIRKIWIDMRPLSLRKAMSSVKNVGHVQHEPRSFFMAA